MGDEHILVNATWREIPLFGGIRLKDVKKSGGILHAEMPMPVGTILTLSPVANKEIRVPARITHVQELAEGGPQMSITFEAAGQLLLSYLEGADGAGAGLVFVEEPVTEEAGASLPFVEEAAPAPASVPPSPLIIEQAPSAELRSAAEAFAKQVVLEHRAAKHSAFTPSVSGEIQLEPRGGSGPTSDEAADKVIVDVGVPVEVMEPDLATVPAILPPEHAGPVVSANQIEEELRTAVDIEEELETPPHPSIHAPLDEDVPTAVGLPSQAGPAGEEPEEGEEEGNGTEEPAKAPEDDSEAKPKRRRGKRRRKRRH